jgi:hypothetical protein
MVLYVDDLLIIKDHIKKIGWLGNELLFQFEMIELGLLKFFISVEFFYLSTCILICQHTYVANILD